LTGVSIPLTLAGVALGLHQLTRAVSSRRKPSAARDADRKSSTDNLD
jgi:hypothetical protein